MNGILRFLELKSPDVDRDAGCIIPTMASSEVLSSAKENAPPADDNSALNHKMKDLTIENITPNVHAINSLCPNPRLKYLINSLTTHLHSYVRETRLSTAEWMTALNFLAQTGQMCNDKRQEFVLLSDILGVSLLVDSVDHPVPEGATEPTVLGPFHTEEAKHIDRGGTLSRDEDGEPLLAMCSVKDLEGKPLEGVSIDIWETDSHGFYDVQNPAYAGPDGRAILTSDQKGKFWYRAIVPVPYPIPSDGPVGKLLGQLGRHCYRPAHMHFMLKKKGFEDLVTALYLKGDKYEYSDAVFGVKGTLVVELGEADEDTAREYGVERGTKVLRYDFVMVDKEIATKLRRERAEEAIRAQGREVGWVDGLPVPALD